MSTAHFLVEIGTEELPPKALWSLAEAFHNHTRLGLEKAGLHHGTIKPYAAPRRLALLISDLALQQPDRENLRRGPALNAAFKEDGYPTPAAEGFAKSCGVTVEELERLESGKGAWLGFRVKEPGQPARGLLPDIIRDALDKLPVPKRMRWADLDAQFVRPVHWVVLLLGNELIDTTILGVKTSRETYGHRFHHPQAIYLAEPEAYAPLLETEGYVVADFHDRREAVRAQVLEAARQTGGTAIIDEALLAEVTSMVEWPRALVGRFDDAFLAVPSEALISAMKTHQKYFHLVDGKGALMPNFITIANIDSRDIEQVRQGNERVIRPRLADAAFFWNQDRKLRLSERVTQLQHVVFQNQLGSIHDKCMRLADLSVWLGSRLQLDHQHCRQAAQLCKADLLTNMVGEFPELQGIMGRYYAHHDGEDDAVALAIEEHYRPRFAGDVLASGGIGQVLAITDKIDTLAGIFGIGQIPTGDKDPFGLRRAALGVLRQMIEGKLDIDLYELLGEAVKGYGTRLTQQQVVDQVFGFMMERLRAYYLDLGVAADTFESVLAQAPRSPLDFDARILAVKTFRELPAAASLATANKRISNIIVKQAADVRIAAQPDATLFEFDEERTLHEQIEQHAREVTPLFARKDYVAALRTLAGLREPVDRFFDKVMVMVDDEKIRNNRLALLNRLRGLFLHTADLSRLQG